MFGLSKIVAFWKKPNYPPWNEHFHTFSHLKMDGWDTNLLLGARLSYFQGQNWLLVLGSGDPLSAPRMTKMRWVTPLGEKYTKGVKVPVERLGNKAFLGLVLGAMTRGWRKSQWGWWLWLRLFIINTVSFMITKCSCCGCCYDDNDDNNDDDNNHDSSVKSGWSCVFQSSYVEDTAPPSIWGQLQCNPVRNACDKTCPNHFPGTSKRRYEKKHIITHNIYIYCKFYSSGTKHAIYFSR